MKRYQWAATGDVNAFCGLVLDNLAGLVLLVGLLVGTSDFPANFALRFIIPGTALGVLVGDLLYTWLAFRLARRTGRTDVTAMPLGLDTPSTFGTVLFVLQPAFLRAREAGLSIDEAARWAWQIGVCGLMFAGVFKLICSLGSGWVRRMVPRAGLLGSLAAVALVLISFLPMLKIAALPIVGFAALAVTLTTLTARIPLPGRVPGALGALLVGASIFYSMQWAGVLSTTHAGAGLEAHAEFAIPTPRFDWLAAIADSLVYLPVVLPFALVTVVGGIDCTESAAAVGDEYKTAQIVAIEGLATLVAALFGGVVQTTPYIGHPAYKAMGGRAAYTLASGLFIGGAGIFGYFTYIYAFIPEAAVLPIMVFVGLEITAQSYYATKRRHFPAVALACVPAMAYLVSIHVDSLLELFRQTVGAEGDMIQFVESLDPEQAASLQSLRMLSGGPSFILISLLWAAALAALIDRKLLKASIYFLVCAVGTLFGVIHSPLPGSRLFVPWNLPELSSTVANQSPFYVASAYVVMALLLAAWSRFVPPGEPIDETETILDENDGGHL